MSNQCPCEDDAGTKCQNVMTKTEKRQDGMCGRCADAVWDTMSGRHQGYKFYYSGNAAFSINKQEKSNVQT